MVTLITLLQHNNGYQLEIAERVAGLDNPILAAIGWGGLIKPAKKREGDGMTPIGRWSMRRLMFRPDRITLPDHHFNAATIKRKMAWCDDPDSPHYNQQVTLPFSASHEILLRDDRAYDVIIPLGYNDAPATPHRGSAIFFHILHDGKAHTEGCVAISAENMMRLIPHISTETILEVRA